MSDFPLENYFGDGSDGILNTTDNISFESELDGPTVFKHFTSIQINEGHTVTTSNRCKGLVIYCSGDCVINGSLSMFARCPNAAGEYFAPNNLDKILTENGYEDFSISATGGAGGASSIWGSGTTRNGYSNSGSAGSSGAGGGGGAGA